MLSRIVRKSLNRKILSALVLLAAVGGSSFAQAADPDSVDGSALTLYGWLPGVSADLRFQSPGGELESKSDKDIFSNLKGFLMVRFDQHYGDWGWTGDLDYVKFSNQTGRFRQVDGENVSGSVNLDTNWGLKGGLFTLAGTYALNRSSAGYTDVLFGGRYIWIKGNLSWDFGVTGSGGLDIANSGHIAQNGNAFDAIVGLRGRWYFGDGGNWYVPYYGDIGAGTNSTSTAQIDLGIGYRFGWGDMSLDYRSVWLEQDKHDALLKNVQLAGPSFNVVWHF